MDRPPINPEKIISRLKFYNYKYKLDGTTLIIYLSILCYLRIEFGTEKVNITSHSLRPGFITRLEYNFMIYGFLFYIITWYGWATLNKGIFVLLGIFLIYFLICFVKTENMKAIIHNWIEKDAA